MKKEKFIVGRDTELSILEDLHSSGHAKLVVVYGRRRIGKTFMIKEFIKDKNAFYFDGLEEGSTEDQLQQVSKQLFMQTKIPLLSSFGARDWHEFFTTLLEVLPKDKCVLVFDELQWLARNRIKLISILKSCWDNYFSHRQITIILCGSIAHFMVRKVIRSKSLYGRINSEILLRELDPPSARKLLNRRGSLESLQYQIVLGGVPKYLTEIDQGISFDANMQKLFFSANSFFWNEVEKVFFSQFKEVRVYRKIVSALANKNLSLSEISALLKIKSGGGLKSYLENLELASFIGSYKPLADKRTKEVKYKLLDGYLRFYYQFIRSREKIISSGKASDLYREQVKPNLNPWLGLAFEVYLHKNAMWLANKLGFADKVVEFGPYLVINSTSQKSQIDLAFLRTDRVITMIEVKFGISKVGKEVIPEVERKALILSDSKYKDYSIEKILIATAEVDKKLLAMEYFHNVVSLEDLLS